MIIHKIHYDNFEIKQGDTLEDPHHFDMRFDVIVANPPFSQSWNANDLKLNDDRFSQYGKLAPKTKADFAFIQHMIHQLDENGIMAVVVPHGVLFRSGAENAIRTYLIDNRNYLDAVIGLPSNIFYGTSIPVAILIFKKCRKNDKDVFFIDASKEFEKVGNKNKLRDSDIDKIAKTLKTRKTIDKYSFVSSLENIKENDYNLNIPRYVDTFEEEEEIDLDEVSKELKEINTKKSDIQNSIKKFCKELNIATPF